MLIHRLESMGSARGQNDLILYAGIIDNLVCTYLLIPNYRIIQRHRNQTAQAIQNTHST